MAWTDKTFFGTATPKVSQSLCTHPTTTLGTIAVEKDGAMGFSRSCTRCGAVWHEAIGKGANAQPSHYLKRKKVYGIFENKAIWTRQEWGLIRPQSREAALKIIDGWNKDAEVMGMAIEYKCADIELKCAKCKKKVSETYKGDLCYACHLNEKVMQMPVKKPKPIPLENPKFVKPVRVEGDIWRLPMVNSPMWTTQWAYQGSAKEPYVVSRRTDGGGGGSVTSQGWACSCRNFTQHSPRTECKHILKVMNSEGFSVNKAAVAMAGVDDAQLKAFKAWQKQQVEAGVAVGVKKEGAMKFFDKTGRKFR